MPDQRTTSPAAPKTSPVRSPCVVYVAASQVRTAGAGAYGPGPAVPRAASRTPGTAAHRRTPSVYARAMSGVSMTWPSTAFSVRATAARKASPAGPAGSRSRPGFVQNCPAPPVSDAT